MYIYNLFPLARQSRARGKRKDGVGDAIPRVPFSHPRFSMVRRLRRRYTILACSASRSSPFHKRAERKLRVLGYKPNQTHVLIYSSCLHPTLLFSCSLVFKIQPSLLFSCSLVLKYTPCLLFLCSLVFKIPPVLLFLCSYVLKYPPILMFLCSSVLKN